MRVDRFAWLGLVIVVSTGLGPRDAGANDLSRRIASLRALGAAQQRPSPQLRRRCRGSEAWRVRAHADRAQIRRAVRDASLRFGVPRRLVESVIRHESAWDPAARSPVGARGLMQLMPATARALGVVCPDDPRENVIGGTRYLRELHDRFGSWERALAAYNAGPTRVERNRIPAETRRYVKRVLTTWKGR